MIISRTPFRISFFGGGTDYPDWYREFGGQVLATSIDKYCYISCRYLPPFFEHKYRLVYSKIENIKKIEEIDHPAVKAVLSWMTWQKGLEIHHDGDLPARSGLGSSSSFTVGLINVLTAMNGKRVSKKEIAEQAIFVEQEVIKESVGSQDQISAAYGGFNKIEFKQDGSFFVEPLILEKECLDQLQDHLMLFFTGVSRNASDVAKSKIENLKNRRSELKKMHEMVDEAIGILTSSRASIKDFGALLHENWKYKKSLSEKVTLPFIDEIYEMAMREGAIGGKLLGAGGGGFFLLMAPPEKHLRIREALKNLIHVPFKFENTGTRIVLYQPDGLK